ncbi:MAG: hypothetical protein WHS88_07845 [Anaerohalosphaeraceae bacterium]
MKYLALLRKEIRECLPWAMTAAGILFIFGFYKTVSPDLRQVYLISWDENPGSFIKNDNAFFTDTSVRDVGPLLLAVSYGLGIALAVRQFWFAHFTKTWPFLLHRSISRFKLLWVKITAAVFFLFVPILGIWTLLFLYACFVRDFPPPPTFRIWLEGLFFITLGAVLYLAAAVSFMLPTRWYTTRFFPVLFAFLGINLAFSPLPLPYLFLFIAILCLYLGTMLFAEFKYRVF